MSKLMRRIWSPYPAKSTGGTRFFSTFVCEYLPRTCYHQAVPFLRQQQPARLRASLTNALLWLLTLVACALLLWVFTDTARTPSTTTPSTNRFPVAGDPAASQPVSPRSIESRPTPTNPVVEPTTSTNGPSSWTPRPVRSTFEAQLALARLGISPGSLDAVLGPQTRSALLAFQRTQGLVATGELDGATRAALILTEPPLSTCSISRDDLARLQPVGTNWLQKSLQLRLDYETIIELVAERFATHPAFLRSLNPSIEPAGLQQGAVLRVPNFVPPPVPAKAAFLRISLSGRQLQAFDSATNVLAHFPCSIAQRIEKRPAGELRIITLANEPNYVFDPENFPESDEARQLNRKLVLPPGPNNPVGTAWIGLDRPGYGIHGTPRPEEVGRTESHGCFRLANWNAQHLLRLVSVGLKVFVEP